MVIFQYVVKGFRESIEILNNQSVCCGVYCNNIFFFTFYIEGVLTDYLYIDFLTNLWVSIEKVLPFKEDYLIPYLGVTFFVLFLTAALFGKLYKIIFKKKIGE